MRFEDLELLLGNEAGFFGIRSDYALIETAFKLWSTHLVDRAILSNHPFTFWIAKTKRTSRSNTFTAIEKAITIKVTLTLSTFA